MVGRRETSTAEKLAMWTAGKKVACSVLQMDNLRDSKKAGRTVELSELLKVVH